MGDNLCKQNVNKAVKEFFDKYAIDTESERAVRQGYSIIGKKDFPTQVHYEFHCTNKHGMNVAFHIENDDFKELGGVLKKFDKQKIDEKVIEFDQTWFKGRNRSEGLGRIFIKFGEERTSADVAKTMRKFIDKTQDKIAVVIKEIQNEEE